MRIGIVFILAVTAVLNAGEGSLHGVVKFEGEVVPPKVVELSEKKAGDCSTKYLDTALLIDPATRGIQNAIIRILDVNPETKPELKTVVVSLQECRFSPRVFIMSPGSSLQFNFPDGIAHNPHWIPLDGKNQPIGRMIAKHSPEVIVKGKHFAEPELMVLVCDIHPWMKGYFAVHDPRYAAITAANGSYEIKNIPAGKYKVIVSHETLGEHEKEIEIKDGAASTLDVTFKQK